MDMRLISVQELKEKLDRGDPIKLVNALGDWEYRVAGVEAIVRRVCEVPSVG